MHRKQKLKTQKSKVKTTIKKSKTMSLRAIPKFRETKQSPLFRRVIASADASARSNPKNEFFRLRRILLRRKKSKL